MKSDKQVVSSEDLAELVADTALRCVEIADEITRNKTSTKSTSKRQAVKKHLNFGIRGWKGWSRN